MNRENAKTDSIQTKTAGANFPMSKVPISVCISMIAYIYSAIPPMDRIFRSAEIIPIKATVINFDTINCLFVTGSVRIVSSVPRSRSPAVVSIAGYIVPISRLMISINGRIEPIILPSDCSLLAVSFFSYAIGSRISCRSIPAS